MKKTESPTIFKQKQLNATLKFYLAQDWYQARYNLTEKFKLPVTLKEKLPHGNYLGIYFTTPKAIEIYNPAKGFDTSKGKDIRLFPDMREMIRIMGHEYTHGLQYYKENNRVVKASRELFAKDLDSEEFYKLDPAEIKANTTDRLLRYRFDRNYRAYKRFTPNFKKALAERKKK